MLINVHGPATIRVRKTWGCFITIMVFFFIYHDETFFVSEKLGKKPLLPDRRCDVILVSEMLENETGTK